MIVWEELWHTSTTVLVPPTFYLQSISHLRGHHLIYEYRFIPPSFLLPSHLRGHHLEQATPVGVESNRIYRALEEDGDMSGDEERCM